MQHVSWDQYQYLELSFLLAATSRGLCAIALPNETLETLEGRIRAHGIVAPLVHDPDRMAMFTHQLDEYFRGLRTTFTLPLDVKGSPFQRSVWSALTQISYGAVQTYTEVARQLGHPRAVRAVGTAIGQNPIPIVVPCHRVIGKDGTLRGYRGGLELKASLLGLEHGEPQDVTDFSLPK